MYVTCGDLFKLRSFSNCKALTGETGLDRVISWPYLAKTVLDENMFDGGEFVLLAETYVPYSEGDLLNFLDICAGCGVAGILFFIDAASDSLKEVPLSVVRKAVEYGIPVFQLPWDVRSISVMKDISLLIFKNEHRKDALLSVLQDIIFCQSAVEEDSMEQLKNLRYRDEPYYIIRIQICTFDDYCASKGIVSEPDKHEHRIYLRHLITNTVYSKFPSAMVCSNSNIIIAIIPVKEVEEPSRRVEAFEDLYVQMMYKLGSVDLRMCVGQQYDTIIKVKQALLETADMIPLTKMAEFHMRPVILEEESVYRLLIAVDASYLRQIYQSVMEPLIKADADGDSDLVDTLSVYLKNDLCLDKTSKDLYLHSNTIRYRLKKIEALTGKSMKSLQDLSMFYYCIHIKNYLGL